MAPKRYYEAEFGLWVEEPDPLRKPACNHVWPDAWSHAAGTRPRCYRPEGHDGEHRETRRVSGGDGWIEYYWESEVGSGRWELRRAGDAGAYLGSEDAAPPQDDAE